MVLGPLLLAPLGWQLHSINDPMGHFYEFVVLISLTPLYCSWVRPGNPIRWEWGYGGLGGGQQPDGAQLVKEISRTEAHLELMQANLSQA